MNVCVSEVRGDCGGLRLRGIKPKQLKMFKASYTCSLAASEAYSTLYRSSVTLFKDDARSDVDVFLQAPLLLSPSSERCGLDFLRV